MTNTRYLILPILTTLLIWTLNNPIGNLPPLGKFLDPFHGYLALVDSDNINRLKMESSYLESPVTVIFDTLRIPHIFAENDMDLYFAQGYIMASERLWQMEFQTHAAGGRLSEIVGEEALGYDRYQRRVGMKYGAENSLNAILKDQQLLPMADAFTEGVNTYIASLSIDQYPLEYKILDYAPEPWTPLKTSLLLKYMAWMLTGRNTELTYTRMWNEMGRDIVEELFPIYPWFVDPIIPPGTKYDFKPVPLDQPPNLYQSKADRGNIITREHEGIGSNNWVVSGNRTKSGHAMLANDPHLGLNLPSIWYAMHLVSPNQNVMGVTLPGAPGIIIGFNDHISWGLTNGYDDVMDWYDIQFKDSTMTEYFHDNKWKPTQKIVEKFKIKGGKTFSDTITFTHHGPIVWDTPYQTLSLGEKSIRNSIRQVSTGRALRWLAHDESNELRTFYLLNTAENYADYVHALEYFNCPGQNFAYADVEGNIALWHAGNTPAKWAKQGMFISDGADPRYDWQATVPHHQKPHVKNPGRGYVGSANQHPTTSDYPYFLSEFYWASFRWNQIHTRLDTLQSATINDMLEIQLDNRSVFAEKTMPIILRTWKNHLKNDLEKQTFTILSNWDYEMNGHSPAPTLYRYWYGILEELTWEDDLGIDNERFIWPYRDKMMELILTNPKSHWFDDKTTIQIETFSHQSLKAFHKMVSDLQNKYGDDILKDWIWAKHQGTDINHVANIPGLGMMGLPTSGGSDIPNATGTTFGPSWRLVVDMGEKKLAYGIYPGGQSGFPGSAYYDNMIDDWVNGIAYPLSFSEKASDISGETIILGNDK